MNKSNSIKNKMKEYEAPKTIVVEVQNEGILCSSSGEQHNSVTLDDFGVGSQWGN